MSRSQVLREGYGLTLHQKVAYWRVGDEVSYRRTPQSRWQRAKIQRIIVEDKRTLYRVAINQKMYLAKESQLGYPLERMP